MSTATKENYDALFTGLAKLDENAREISADKRERIESFAKNYGVNKDAVKTYYGLWKLKQKDEQKYHEVAGDLDAAMSVGEA